GSSSQIRSRPRHVLRTRPARSRSSRCFVIAWRETRDRSLSRAIDPGPAVDSRTRSRKRVSSPRAAESGAASCACVGSPALALDMAANVLDLLGPAVVVHAECLRAAPGRNPIETGLGEREHRAALRLFEAELDERRWLRRVIDLRIDR